MPLIQPGTHRGRALFFAAVMDFLSGFFPGFQVSEYCYKPKKAYETDLNGDGIDDTVTVSGAGSPSITPGNGDGSYTGLDTVGTDSRGLEEIYRKARAEIYRRENAAD